MIATFSSTETSQSENDQDIPRGTLVWFDDQTGEGLIRRDGREYPVRSPDIESAARVPADAVGRARKEDGWSRRQFNKQSITGGSRGIDVRPMIVMRAPG